MAEQVNHPEHYGGDTTYEAIKVIEAWGLGFCLGNTVKYIARAGKKPYATLLTDLHKARWYLDREIQRLESMIEEQEEPPVLGGGTILVSQQVQEDAIDAARGVVEAALRNDLRETLWSAEEEHAVRIRYQDIVYQVCNLIDVHYPTKRSTVDTVVEDLRSLLTRMLEEVEGLGRNIDRLNKEIHLRREKEQGEVWFWLGGSLAVGAGQTAGSYSGVYTFSAVYQ
jgi:hypothetical protein